MEQNTPIIAKKIWNLMRVAFFMLRKGICKRKILLDLNLVMKRGKLAGKALQNLMFHHHHHYYHRNHKSSRSKATVDVPSDLQYFSTTPSREYEFSCTNTPLHHNINYYTPYTSFEELNNSEAVNNVFHLMNLSSNNNVKASSALSRLGSNKRNLNVRQLRITDSPFPVHNTEDDSHVDAAAEDFINRFYSQLKNQKYY